MSSESAAASAGLDPARMPAHVAMIMDGNGRWAKRRLMNRVRGHQRGVEVVRDMVRSCADLGIAHLTLYAFSTENWARPRSEVSALMELLKKFLRNELGEMLENGIRLSTVGQIERLPADVREKLRDAIGKTAHGRRMTLHLALSYGGRDELVSMARSLAEKVRDGELDPTHINEAAVAAHLYTRDVPDPDLLIRTSGEQRLSNFLLWQIAYAELFFTDTLWPDFTREELIQILRAYQGRDRRFGKVDPAAS
ncbi:MAG: isoprenyl transferase [Desulfococcaceae bacterium]